MQYFYSPINQGFFIDIVNPSMPTDVIAITEKQYKEFFEKQASGKYTWFFDIETKEFVYTKRPFKYEEIAKQQCIIKAQALLMETDWQVLADKFKSYSTQKQAAIIEYREQLREVVRGHRNELPVFKQVS